MRKGLIRMAVGILLVFLAVAIAGFAYLQHPAFGQLSQGEALDRIIQSPNYINGAFRNQIADPALTNNSNPVMGSIGPF